MPLVIVGFISILAQAVLLRELSVAFYGIELIYLLALGAWLFWGAIGAMVSRRRLDPSSRLVPLLLLAFSLLLPLDIAVVRGIRILFSAVPGAFLPIDRQLIAMAAALLPMGFLSGLLFQKAALLFIRPGRSLPLAYAIESAGGLIGGLAATISLRCGVQNFALGIFCALAAAAAALAAAGRHRDRVLALPAIALLAPLLLVMLESGAIDRKMTSWTHPGLLDTRDSPYSRITLTQAGRQVSVFENDALAFETEGTAAEELVHLAALQHARPARVLLLGGGIEGAVREALKHAPERLVYVELNRVLMDLALPHLSDEVRASIKAPVVTVVWADPRGFLEGMGSYDLILVAMPEPTSGQANRFYTAEFFGQCAARLGTHGVLAFRLSSSENLWTSQLLRRNGSIYRSLRSVFRDVVVLPGASNLFLASQAALPRNPELLAERLAERGVKTRLVSRPYLSYLYTNDRFVQVNRALEGQKFAANTDEHPVCFQHAVLLWLSKFFPRLGMMDLPTSISLDRLTAGSVLTMAAAILALLVTGWHWPCLGRVLLAGIAGFVGMVLETILILQYQVKRGVLYQDIGVLLMSFMTGMAIGAWVTGRFRAGCGGRTFFPWGGVFLSLGSGAAALVIGSRIRTGVMGGLAETGLWLAVCGAFVAGIFAYAGSRGIQDPRAVVAPLYAADLIGGCGGSLAGSLLLVPLAGLSTAAFLMIPLSLLSIAFLRALRGIKRN